MNSAMNPGCNIVHVPPGLTITVYALTLQNFVIFTKITMDGIKIMEPLYNCIIVLWNFLLSFYLLNLAKWAVKVCSLTHFMAYEYQINI